MHIERTRAFITALSVLLLCSAVHAQTSDPRQHLRELARANSLEMEGSQPWHLLMTFQLNDLDGKSKDSGTIEEWWVSPESHRLEIRSESYNFTDPAPSDAPAHATRNRESYLVSELLGQVTDPIPDYGDFKGLVASEATRAFGKVTLSCVIVTRPPRRPTQFCFEPGTSTLRGFIEESQFSAVRNNMAKFRGIYLGLDNSLAFSGKVAITGHLDKLESFHPDGSIALSTAPSGTPSIVPGAVLEGRAVSKQQPNYPYEARSRHIMGTVVLCATISKQGTISLVDVISSPSPILTGSAMQAVKQWTYQPYLLNGSPVEVETTITVNYNMNDGS